MAQAEAEAGKRELEMERLKVQMNYEQAQALKLANIMSLLSSVRDFSGDVRALECFIQRMDQVQDLVESMELGAVGNKSIQGFMMSKIEMGLLLDLGLSFASSWSEAKNRLKERYRGATRTAGRVAWRMARLSMDASESLGSFCRRLSDVLRQTKDRVTESCGDPEVVKVKLDVYEELAMETLLNELPERLRTTARAAKSKDLEELVRMVREEELEREEQRVFRARREARNQGEGSRGVQRRSYAEVSRNQAPRFRTERREGPVRGSGSPRWNSRNEVVQKEVRRGPRPGGAARFQCWACGEEGHLSRNCRYRHVRRTQREADQNPWRNDGGEPMEVNAIDQDTSRGSRLCRYRGDSERDRYDDGQSSVGKGEGIETIGEREESTGPEEPWTVVQHGRPWRARKDVKME